MTVGRLALPGCGSPVVMSWGGLVDGELPRREPAQSGVFGVPDAVLDPGVGTVSGFEEGELPDLGVGSERLVAPPVTFLEQRQLGPGMGGTGIGSRASGALPHSTGSSR